MPHAYLADPRVWTFDVTDIPGIQISDSSRDWSGVIWLVNGLTFAVRDGGQPTPVGCGHGSFHAALDAIIGPPA